jgi:hypothetical protein
VDEEARSRLIHPTDCECDNYGCQLRRKGIRLSANASQTARARRPFRPSVQPSWEKGTAGEHRADGSFMPYIDDTGRKIHVKEMGERRRELTDIRRRQVEAPVTKE